jgi:hypothetical protein
MRATACLVALWAVFSEIQTGAVGLVVRDYLAVSRWVYPRNISRAFKLARATAFAGNAGAIGALTSILVWMGSCTAPISSRPDAKCAQIARVFRLRCKIPIINLSELVRGFAIMKAVRDAPGQNDVGATDPCGAGLLIWKMGECIK